MASYDRPNRSKYFNGPIYDQMAEDLQLAGRRYRQLVHVELVDVELVDVELVRVELNPVSTFVYEAPLSPLGERGWG